MASIRLPPPDRFNFCNPDEWPKWKRRFEQFRSAAGLVTEDEEREVSTLLYCLEEADDVLTSTNISAADRKKYISVVAKFDSFFKVRRNVIFEQARFNKRNQLDGKSAEQYITQLYGLMEYCEFGELRDEMLRDWIVVGIRDTAFSERLQLDAYLTLEKVKKQVRQKEAVKEQHKQLQGATKNDPIVLDEVKGCRQRGAKPSFAPPKKGSPSSMKPPCKRCGKEWHAADKCPARGATCHKCKRKGHYSAQCFSKTAAAAAHELNLDAAFLGTVTSEQEALWTTPLLLGKQDIVFKLDTGAEVTAISEAAYKTLGKMSLQAPSKALYAPTCQSLKVLGQFTGTLTHRQHSVSQPIFVVRGLKTNLLGLPSYHHTPASPQGRRYAHRWTGHPGTVPKRVPGTGNPRGGVRYQIERGCGAILTIHPQECTISPPLESRGRSPSYGVSWSHLQDR